MKLNTKAFRYLSPDDWRVLTAVEVGSKNHEVVPTPLIIQLSALRTGVNTVHKCISTLAKADLVAKVRNVRYDGYRLTYGGLDYLALHAHTKSDSVVHLGSQMGVGKESDIYLCTAPSDSGAHGSPVQSILKIHRLGRTSFRSLANNRDYKGNRAHCTWQYLSRLSAQKEHTAMRVLYEAGFQVPRPIAWNRHTVVMSLVPGIPLRHVPLSAFAYGGGGKAGQTRRIARLYEAIVEVAVQFAQAGVIHGDFNEFNILIENVPEPEPEPEAEHEHEPGLDQGEDGGIAGDEAKADRDGDVEGETKRESGSRSRKELPEMKPWVIDFPQITSISHLNAAAYFARDINCIRDYFRKRYQFIAPTYGENISNKQTLGRRVGEENEPEEEGGVEGHGGAEEDEYDDAEDTIEEREERSQGLEEEESSPTLAEALNSTFTFPVEQNRGEKDPKRRRRLDVDIEAAGFSRKMARDLSSYYNEHPTAASASGEEEEEEEGQEDGDEGEVEHRDTEGREAEDAGVRDEEGLQNSPGKTAKQNKKPQKDHKDKKDSRGRDKAHEQDQDEENKENNNLKQSQVGLPLLTRAALESAPAVGAAKGTVRLKAKAGWAI